MDIFDRTISDVPFKILKEKEHHLAPLTSIDLKHLEAFPGCVRLKHSSARTVYYLTNEQILLKIFRPVTFFDKVRFSLFSSKAQLEFEAMLFAQAQQLATSTPIGFGIDVSKKSYLWIEAIPEVQPLDRLFAERYAFSNRSERNEVLQELALLIVQMHQCGILHPDFHAGNILWSEKRKKAWVIDLYQYKKNRTLERKPCLHNLVIFNRVFQLKASRTDRLRFFCAYTSLWNSAYYKESHQTLSVPDQTLRKHECLWLEKHTSVSNLQFWKQRERRCQKENKYFGRIASQGYTGFAKKNPNQGTFELSPEVLKKILELLQTPGKFPPEASWIKEKSRTTRVLKIATGEQIYYVKQYLPQSLGYQFKSLWRTSRARKAWLLGYRLLTRGLFTGEPVLVLEKKRFGLLLDSILVIKEIPEFQSILLSESPDKRKQELEKIAKYFRQFHDRGFSHRDLKGPNLLWGKEGLYFLDLDGVKNSPPSPKIRCRDLGRFIYWLKEESSSKQLSFEEIENFVQTYLYSLPALISIAKEQYYFQRIQQYLQKKSKQRQKKLKGRAS
ncbi:MAG: lipopolysaccharide kinase InaA family protein [Planctomycetota bacterium]